MLINNMLPVNEPQLLTGGSHVVFLAKLQRWRMTSHTDEAGNLEAFSQRVASLPPLPRASCSTATLNTHR